MLLLVGDFGFSAVIQPLDHRGNEGLKKWLLLHRQGELRWLGDWVEVGKRKGAETDLQSCAQRLS